MGQLNRITPLVVLFVLFVGLQLVLIGLDCRQTPASVAKQFVKEYYYLDADMQTLLCAKQGDPAQWVQGYIQSKREEASQRGLGIDYLRKMFTKMHVKIEHQGTHSAVVDVKGTTRVAINPVFMVIGKMFGIGQNYPVEATVDLVKENGRWRVCGGAFGSNS